MKKSKKFLSVILAVLIAFSGMTVGFYAMAADEDTATKDSAVTEIESAITDFNTNKYNTLMFSTKEAEAEQKAAAIKAFDELCAKIKKLTDAQKLQLELSNYVYVIGLAADQAGRNAGKTSTTAKVYGATTEFAAVTEKLGTLPSDYQKGYDFAKSLYVKVDGTLFNSSFDFKKKEAGYAHYDEIVPQLKSLSPESVRFANYLNPNGDAFYFYCTSPTSTASYVTSQISGLTFNYYQDKMTAKGTSPSISYSTFIQRSYKDGTWTCSWKSGYDGVSYKKAYDDYLVSAKSDMVAPAVEAYNKLAELFGAVYGQSFTDAAKAAYETGIKYYETGSITVAEINSALDKINAVTGDAATVLNSIMGNSNIKVAVNVTYPMEYTAQTTAEEAYNNQIKAETKTVANLVSSLRDVLSQLQLDEFVKAVNEADLNKLDSKTVESIRAQYAAMTTAFQNKVDLNTLAKFMQIVKPAASDYDFAKEVKNFKTTPVDRYAVGGDVIWTEEGIQSSVDGIWNLVVSAASLAGLDINLNNGLNDVLEDNLYQITIVEAIFDLYATLSHNETETGVSLAPTIGKVIQLLISASGTANLLVQDDNKFAGAIEKIRAITLTDEDKNAGLNDLDKLAAIEFTAEDFGFIDGDQEGFIDALLAALRPLTALLSGDNGILGIAGVKINMFDSVDAQGNYSEDCIYAMLLPLFEQLGMTDLPTPIEYRTNYYTIRENEGKNLGYDAILRDVVESLFLNVVQPVADDPLNGLIEVLPRIAYVVSTNMVDETVKKVIQSTGDTLAGLAGSLDLSADAINNMITGINIDLTDVVGKPASIKLKAIDWATLANCCTVSVVESKSNSNEYFVLRTGETDSCFTTVFYYLYDVVFADSSNYSAVKGLLNSLLDSSLSSVVFELTDNWVNIGKYATYKEILEFTGEVGDTPIDHEETPDDNGDNNPDVDTPDDNNDNTSGGNNGSSGIWDKLKDMLGVNDSSGNGTSNTSKTNSTNGKVVVQHKNRKSPRTGADGDVFANGAVVISSSVALTIALAFVLIARKRKALNK